MYTHAHAYMYIYIRIHTYARNMYFFCISVFCVFVFAFVLSQTNIVTRTLAKTELDYAASNYANAVIATE